MKLPTIQVPITPGKSDDKERDRFLQQVRSLSNAVYRPATLTGTSDGAGTSLVLWESKPLLTDEVVDITAYIRGVSGATNVRFVVDVTAQSVSGVAALSTTSTIASRTIGGESGSFSLTATNAVQLLVNDNGVNAYEWTANVEVR